MASFDTVNYSLRPSKNIQRQIIFEGLRCIQQGLPILNQAYVGMGSIWFTDFILAHKLLGIHDMVSIESDEIGKSRARFNSPFATIKVWPGRTGERLPDVYADPVVGGRPLLTWLDYDYAFDETMADDVRSVVERSPADSVLLITFNAHETRYGDAQERPGRLRALFGSLVPDGLSKRNCKGDRMTSLLADYALGFMNSVAVAAARPGGFVPAFRVPYKDGSQMVTVGGILPSREHAAPAATLVGHGAWPCMPLKSIDAPHLTNREAAVLQSLLPRAASLTRDDVRGLGFDLDSDQIAAFPGLLPAIPLLRADHGMTAGAAHAGRKSIEGQPRNASCLIPT